MPTVELSPHHKHHAYDHSSQESEGLRSSAFSINYTTRTDTKKGIPARNVSLNIREGSFTFKPELDSTLHSLCDSLQISVPHCDHDIPRFVRSSLYTVDEKTGQEKPHFENEVISTLFPDGDIAAHKVKKFLSTAQAPEKADQCCEIKGAVDGREKSIHFHGPYQADNKTRLTLLALVGYEPAQHLLAKLVENQPELRGEPPEKIAIAIASTIVDRKEEAAHTHHHDHAHEEHDHDHHDRTHHHDHAHEEHDHDHHDCTHHHDHGPEEHDEHESHETYKSLEEKILSIIRKGKFEDHPEVLKWWTSQDEDAMTATYGALKKNILQAEQPAEPLDECGDVKFIDVNGPIHFHSGIADRQKRRLLEVIAVWNATPDEHRTRQTERMYQKAVAIVSVYFHGHADFKSLEGELKQAKDESSIAAVLNKIGTTAINKVNDLYPDKQITVGHNEDEKHHEKVEKLTWEQRLQTATNLIITSALHSEDPRMQEQFQKITGKGFLGKIELAEQLPEILVNKNKDLTAQFVKTLQKARAENPNLDGKAFIVKLAQIHDPSIVSINVDKYQDKNIQFTNQDAIKILALHLEILSRPEGIKVSPEQLAKEKNIHDLAKQLQKKVLIL